MEYDKRIKILQNCFDKAYSNGLRKFSMWNACHKNEIKEKPMRFFDSRDNSFGSYHFSKFEDKFFKEHWKDYVVFCYLDSEKLNHIKEYIFDHDFAKYFFGEDWKNKLMKMVILDDNKQIEFLKKHL